MQGNEELISQVVAAITQLPQFQLLDQIAQNPQLLQSIQGGGGEPAVPDVPGTEPTSVEPTVPTDGPPGQPADPEDDLADVSDLIVPGEGEEPEEKNGMVTDALSMANPVTAAANALSKGNQDPSRHTAGHNPGAAVDKYAQLHAEHTELQRSHNALVGEHGRMAEQVKSLYRAKEDGERAATIHKLAAEYPQLVDADSELEICLYARGSELTAEAFKSYIGTVTRFAQKAATKMREGGEIIPAGNAPAPATRGSRGEPTREEAEVAAEATRFAARHNEDPNAQFMSYQQAKEEILKQRAAG